MGRYIAEDVYGAEAAANPGFSMNGDILMGSNVVQGLPDVPRLQVGLTVRGRGIPEDTVILAVNADTIDLSQVANLSQTTMLHFNGQINSFYAPAAIDLAQPSHTCGLMDWMGEGSTAVVYSDFDRVIYKINSNATAQAICTAYDQDYTQPICFGEDTSSLYWFTQGGGSTPVRVQTIDKLTGALAAPFFLTLENRTELGSITVAATCIYVTCAVYDESTDSTAWFLLSYDKTGIELTRVNLTALGVNDVYFDCIQDSTLAGYVRNVFSGARGTVKYNVDTAELEINDYGLAVEDPQGFQLWPGSDSSSVYQLWYVPELA